MSPVNLSAQKISISIYFKEHIFYTYAIANEKYTTISIDTIYKTAFCQGVGKAVVFPQRSSSAPPGPVVNLSGGRIAYDMIHGSIQAM